MILNTSINKPEVINVIVFNNKVEITYRQKSNEIFCSFPPQPVPDKVWKDIYIVRDNALVFDGQLKGVPIPNKVIPEEINFKEGGGE